MASRNDSASFNGFSLNQRQNQLQSLGFSLSLAIHAAFGLWLWTTVQPSTDPMGVFRKGNATIVEFMEGSSSANPAAPQTPPKVIAHKTLPKPSALESVPTLEPKIKLKERAEAALQEESSSITGEGKTQLGFKNGTATQGELGRPNGSQVDARERYLYELRVLLEGKKQYPVQAKRLGETGRVVVTFEVNPNGEIAGGRVKTPSPYARLNEAALRLIQETQRFRPLPVEIAQDKLIVDVPIDYKLVE